MTELPVTYTMRAYRGDTWVQTFRLKWNGVYEDLSTATVAAWAADCATGAQHALVTTGDASGYVTVALPAGFAVGQYAYDVEVKYADATVTTWVRGRLIVAQDVTNLPGVVPAETREAVHA